MTKAKKAIRSAPDAMLKKYEKAMAYLYEKLKSGKPSNINVNETTKKLGLNPRFSRIIGDLKIVSHNGAPAQNSRWTWTGPPPTPEMAKAIYDVTTKMQREVAGGKSVKLKPGQRKINPEKIKNVKAFLDGIYKLIKDAKVPVPSKSLRLGEQASKFKIYNSLTAGLFTLKIMEKYGENTGTSYRWIGPAPTDKMAVSLIMEEKNYKPILNAKSKTTTPAMQEKKAVAPKADKEAWKQVAHKAIDMNDPHLALMALNKL